MQLNAFPPAFPVLLSGWGVFAAVGLVGAIACALVIYLLSRRRRGRHGSIRDRTPPVTPAPAGSSAPGAEPEAAAAARATGPSGPRRRPAASTLEDLPTVAGGAVAQPERRPAREVKRTTFMVLPRFEGAALMPASPGKLLGSLKSALSQLVVEQAGSGIRHEEGAYVVLPETLRSAWIAKVNHQPLGDLKFLVGQTRSTWVVVYDQPHERLYEDPRFMGIELKRRDVTRTPKGKTMYVSRIDKSDLDKLNAIAAQDARAQEQPDTLAPSEGSFSYDDTLARLRLCRLHSSTPPGFALERFVASIQFMTPTQASAGNYYYLDAGETEDAQACELHVGQDPEHPEDVYRQKAVLFYNAEPCYLYIDIRYG